LEIFLFSFYSILSEGGGLDEANAVTQFGEERIGWFQKLVCVAGIRRKRAYRPKDRTDWIGTL
jgi:hypothetical protein